LGGPGGGGGGARGGGGGGGGGGAGGQRAVSLVEGDEGGVCACLSYDGYLCEDGAETDSVGQCGEGGGGWKLQKAPRLGGERRIGGRDIFFELVWRKNGDVGDAGGDGATG
jgi:hypothetical protein